MKNKILSNKGITLIALVITIIVLLILVGIVIAALTGENGILTRARDARAANAIGEAKDASLSTSDSRCYIQPYITAYQTYLQNELGAINATATVGRYKSNPKMQTYAGQKYYGKNLLNPSETGKFWLAQSYDTYGNVWRINENGDGGGTAYNADSYVGVRPVIYIDER